MLRGILCIAVASGVCAAQPPASWPEAVERLRATLPSRGAWTAEFGTGEGRSANAWRVTYNWGDRSWALAGGVGVMAILGDRTRVSVRGGPQGSPPTIHSIPQVSGTWNLPGSDEPMDDYFPAVLVRALVEQPDDVSEFEALADGGFRVVARWPGGLRNQNETSQRTPPLPVEPVTLRFDERARLVRRESGSEPALFVVEFAYDERSSVGLGVPSEIRKQVGAGPVQVRRLVSVEPLTTAQVRAALRPESLRQSSIDLLAQIAAAKAGVAPASESIESAPTTLATAPPNGPPPPAPPLVRYRLPLIVAGLVAIAIGATAWWRRTHP